MEQKQAEDRQIKKEQKKIKKKKETKKEAEVKVKKLRDERNIKEEFDNLIMLLKSTKEDIETLKNNVEEYAEDYFDDLMNDDLPHHQWGGKDGNELIFDDDEHDL